MAPCLLYSTHPDLAQARITAQALLADKLAACCNILPGMESHYEWHGERQHAQEVILLSKTRMGLRAQAIAAIAALHPYDCPAILEIPVAGGHAPYLAWLDAQLPHSCD
jgi:periplasmic divalent cation tolerance protein